MKERSSRARTFGALGSLALWTVVLGLGAACGPPDLPEQSNILLITVDTLRADHLGSYGYSRDTSPFIDRLAREGVRFDQANAQWPKTAPSFASMFTATYPKNNGIVRRVAITLPEEFLMLAEVLQANGYQTRAVVANGAVGSFFRFNQGFDSYDETWKGREETPEAERDGADAVNRLAIASAKEIDRKRPFFLWIHYIDPHYPYSPPGEWPKRFDNDAGFQDPTQIAIIPGKRATLGGIAKGQVVGERTDLAFYVSRYDAEIAYVDSRIEGLTEELDRLGLLDNTLTVFTSDHGESLGEHSYYFDHGHFGFQNTLRVPLVFHYPGVFPADVEEDPVGLIHLAPTLLEIAGVELKAGEWMQGRSMLSRLKGEKPEAAGPIYVFSEAGYGVREKWQRIVRGRRFKLVWMFEGGVQRRIAGEIGKRFALFDLQEDPGETVDVIDDHDAVGRRLGHALIRWWETPFDAMVTSSGEQTLEGMDEATRRQLKALGYLQ